ncbi:MAG: helix-turn-helix transcriptional regulator, partial [Planctomycetes bacterium]|nr:helix-turn-helix transcriptional regulator [Planctomycetota bacterium]
NDSDTNVQEVHTAGKLVPVINDVVAGYPVDFDDKGYPPGGADDYVRCPDLHDPNAFAVRVVGDSMEPKYHKGDIIVFSPSSEVRSGDDCFVRMADPHATTFKQVFFEDNQNIRLQPRNHQYSPTILPREKINGLWRAVIRYERLSD